MGIVVSSGVDEALADLVDVDLRVSEDELDRVAADLERPVDVVILGPLLEDPVGQARRVGERFPESGILILYGPGNESSVRQRLQFAPFLSRHVRSMDVDPPDVVAEKVGRMAAEVRARRRYGGFITSVQDSLPTYDREKQRDGRYLDLLLEHAPLGILLVDDDGCVLDINPESARMLNIEVPLARGRSVFPLFEKKAGFSLETLIRDAGETPHQPESTVVELETDGEPRSLELTVARSTRTGRTLGTLVMLRDVTDRLAAERITSELQQQRAVSEALEKQAGELQRLNTELERSNRELQEFAHIASHDLQEPLRKVVSFADLLISDHGDELDEDGRFLLDRMQSAAVRMSDMVRGLLSFSRIRTRPLELERVDLADAVDDVLLDLSLSIEDAGAEIDVSELPIVKAEESQMRSLFQNLIANSLKFRRSDVGLHIEIASEAHPSDPGRRLVVVSDNGIGFDQQFAEKVFAPFQRLHARNRYGGTGMGLAICRRIVERHGGTITAESGPDDGARFTIDLPVLES